MLSEERLESLLPILKENLGGLSSQVLSSLGREARDHLTDIRRSKNRRRELWLKVIERRDNPKLPYDNSPLSKNDFFLAAFSEGRYWKDRLRQSQLYLDDIKRQRRELRLHNNSGLRDQFLNAFLRSDRVTQGKIKIEVEEGIVHLSYTLDCTLESTWVGELSVIIPLSHPKSNTRVYNDNTRKGYPHPHVNERGRVCWGTSGILSNADIFQSILISGDLLSAIDYLDAILLTYNPSSPYIALSAWSRPDRIDNEERDDDDPTRTCRECGSDFDMENEGGYSDYLDDYLCDDCAWFCQSCNYLYPLESFNSDHDLCMDCYNETFVQCTDCEEDIMREGDYTVYNDNGEPYCQDCYCGRYSRCDYCDVEYEHSKEGGESEEGYPLCGECFEEYEEERIIKEEEERERVSNLVGFEIQPKAPSEDGQTLLF